MPQVKKQIIGALARKQGKKSEVKKSTEIMLSLTIFGRFLEGNLSLTIFGRPKYGQTEIGPSKCGQSQISLQKPSKYGQTQPIFDHFFDFPFLG